MVAYRAAKDILEQPDTLEQVPATGRAIKQMLRRYMGHSEREPLIVAGARPGHATFEILEGG